MNLAALLENAARSFPDRPAVSTGAHLLFDYATLARRSAGLSAALSGALARGERVAIAMTNCPEYLEILFGIWRGGFAAAPMSAKLNAIELAFMIDDCGAKIVFADEGIGDALTPFGLNVQIVTPSSKEYSAMIGTEPESLVNQDAGDLAWIFYTSGTTGKPKGAMLSHGNLLAMTLGYFADIDPLDERDALLHLAATSHASGLFALSHIAKASNNILPESGGYDPAEMASIIDRTPNLTFFAPPTLLRRMVGDSAIQDTQHANIKTILVGAAPVLERDIRSALALFGPKLWNGYGQGESPCTITAMSKKMLADASASEDASRLVSVGVARTGVEVRIKTDQPDNSEGAGEVLVRGPTVMRGYWNRPDATAAALQGGWLHTGDLGVMDGRGFLSLWDRKKDLIISGGMNIYAREVEDVLVAGDGVAEVAVIGLPDDEWGESVAAVIVAGAGAAPDPAALDQLCLKRIARYKRPRAYFFVESLPKNAGGKVLKRVLRGRFGAPGSDPEQGRTG